MLDLILTSLIRERKDDIEMIFDVFVVGNRTWDKVHGNEC